MPLKLDFKINIAPDDSHHRWGTLAHISEKDREQVINSGFGEMKKAIQFIEKELKRMNKELDKKKKDRQHKLF